MENIVLNDSKIIIGNNIIENCIITNNIIIKKYIYYLEDDSELIIKNCIFKINNIENSNIFYCNKSKLIIENCSFEINNLKNKKNILFYLNQGCYLEINKSKININSSFFNDIILNTKLSIIKISDTNIIKNPIITNVLNIIEPKNYLINNIYSNISIDNCKLINNVNNGNIIYNSNLEYILQFNYFDKFIIENKKLIIDYHIKNYLLTIIKGIIYNYDDKYIRYIFTNHNIKNNKIIFNLDYISDSLDDITKTNIEIDYLFLLEITNSYIKENTNETILNEQNTYPKNYFINIINTNINNNTNNYCNLLLKNNKLTGIKISNDGTIFSKNIISENIYGNGLHLKNLGLKNYNNNLDIYKESKIKGIDNINFSTNLKINGNNNFILGNKNNINGRNNYINGKNNIIKGNNNYILGNNIKSHNSNIIILGKYNEIIINPESILEIGTGKNEENRNTILSIFNNSINIKGLINTDSIRCNDITIDNNNILGIDNVEINENIYCEGNVYINDKIEGENNEINKNLVYNNILNIQDNIITVIKIDLKDLIVSKNSDSIIGYNFKDSKIYNIDEANNGVLYKCEIMCLEEPSYKAIKFISTKYNNLYKGHIIKNRQDFNKEDNIDLFYSDEWRKGMFKEYTNFSYNELFNFNIYIMKNNNIKLNKDIIISKGKFIIKFKGFSF